MRDFFSYNFKNKFVLRKIKEKSSHYGPNMLGYTCATKLKTNSYYDENSNKSIKINIVQIVN